MAGIKGRNTKPEMLVRKALHAEGFRFRLHDRRLPGTPDIVLPKWRAVVFVHGCFWHRHEGCRYATTPVSNGEFWQRKFNQNISRDHQNAQRLVDIGWRVTTIWECELKQGGLPDRIENLVDWLRLSTNEFVPITDADQPIWGQYCPSHSQ
ncbi:very short patch repair endonuclease [Sandarakinorhabdus cyanobacteriorum]|nr:very short patch repair endonuclease [Sandarakinorhabdus cyanobacteriorum]